MGPSTDVAVSVSPSAVSAPVSVPSTTPSSTFSPALPPGVPSSSGISSAAPPAKVKSALSGKRVLGEGDKFEPKGKIAKVVEFRDGKECILSGRVEDVSMAGRFIKGSVDVGVQGSSQGIQGGSQGGLRKDDNMEEEEEGDEEEEREEGEIREGDDYDNFSFPAFPVDRSPTDSEWSTWHMLKHPYSLVLHNGQVRALYNCDSGLQIPAESLKLATLDDGSRMFQYRRRKTLYKVKKSAEIFGTRSDKSRAIQFFGTFNNLFPEVSVDFNEGWMDSYDSLIRIPSDCLAEADFPFSLAKANKIFQDLASGVTLTLPTLSPIAVPFVSQYEDILACLPVPKFPSSILANDFGVSVSGYHLKKELLNLEYNRRMALLATLSLFSAELACHIVPGEIKSPSAFESSMRNRVGGFSGAVQFLCNNSFRQFAEARIELRRSAFKDPKESFSLRLIRASPFSKSLFCSDEIQLIRNEFGKCGNRSLSWEKLLKKGSSGDKASAPKQGPSHQPKPKSQPQFRGGFSQNFGRGKGGPGKSSRGGPSGRGQKFRGFDNQKSSRGRGGQRN